MKNGTQRKFGGTQRRDTSRARARPFGDTVLCPCVPLGHTGRDTSSGTRDATPPGIASRSGHSERTAEHKAKLAQDPRFAGWLGLMAADDPDPSIGQAAQRRAEERLELTRRAKYSFLLWAQDNPETDPAAIAEARQFLDDHPPLRRALGTGESA